MVRIEGGSFAMGWDAFYPEERPVHTVAVDGFWIDEHPVTVAEFRRFVKATGHVTLAELAPDGGGLSRRRPGPAGTRIAGVPAHRGPGRLHDYRNWWAWTPGATGATRKGPAARCTVASGTRSPMSPTPTPSPTRPGPDKALPTEAEWEYAARGGLDGAVYPWGDEFAPKGRMMANTWQGEFPWQNLLPTASQGRRRSARSRPTATGSYDMAGNVWEWTADFFTPRHRRPAPAAAAARPATRGSAEPGAAATAGPDAPSRGG